jgi:transposase-like protein
MRKIELSEAMKSKLTRLYVRDRLSSREVAERLGVGDRTARRWLHLADIPLRSNAARPRTDPARLDRSRLYSDLIRFGVEGTAKRMKVSKRTLQGILSRLRNEAKNEKTG